MEKFVDREFLEYLVKSIVDHPDEVKIERTVDERGVLLRLKVNLEDMGQVVGRAGKTAGAIRSLLNIVGIKNNAKVSLKIDEPEGSTHLPAGRQVSQERREEPAQGSEINPVADEMSL